MIGPSLRGVPKPPLFRVGMALVPGCALMASCAAPPVVVETPVPTSPPAVAASPLPVPIIPIVFSGELEQGGFVRGTVPPGTARLTIDGQPLGFTPDGRFFAAFDRDAGPAAQLVATLADGRQVSAGLAIAPRAWQIERVSVGKRPAATPSAAFERRRPAELARIAQARAVASGAQGWRQDFLWPVQGRVSGRFGAQRIYRGEPGAYHSGLDIAGGAGTAFTAPADGVVVLAAQEPFTLEGNLLIIDHGMGLNSAFLHCSQLLVKEGDVVRQGQVIGRIGATGRATGPHLHWSIKWKDRRVDPLLFLRAAGA